MLTNPVVALPTLGSLDGTSYILGLAAAALPLDHADEASVISPRRGPKKPDSDAAQLELSRVVNGEASYRR